MKPHAAESSGEEVLERQLLGVRILALAFRHAPALLGLMGVGLVLGVLAGLFAGRPYETRAAIELGGRPASEPLEMPLVARARLLGILEKNRARFPGMGRFAIENRRDKKTGELTKTLDVRLEAETSSAARGILDASLAELLVVHAQMHAFESELIARERAYYERAEAHVNAALDAHRGTTIQVTNEKGEQQLLPPTAAILEVQRRIGASSMQLSLLRTPPTRIVEGPTVPKQKRSRVLWYGLAGALVGACLANLGFVLRFTGIGPMRP